MKVAKALIGKRVCLSWRDPCTFEAEGQHEMALVPTRDALPLWEECGWIAAVNEGLVKLVHARCRMPAASLNGTPEETGTVVFEDLVETLEVWPDVPAV
jgi:hypothetical protein